MLIGIDHPWRCAVSSVERLVEEPFYSSSIPLSCEEKVQGIPVLVNGSIQPSPLTFDFHVDFIDSPRVSRGTQIATAALVHLRSISLDPPEHG